MLYKWQRYFFQVSFFVLMISGVYFFIIKYLLKPSGEFSIINHPLQNFMLKTHIISAIFFIFSIGSITIPHILYKIKIKEQKARKTGIVQIVIVLLCIISGYLLQVLSNKKEIEVMAYLHIIISFILIFLIYLHQWLGKKKCSIYYFNNICNYLYG